MTEGPAAPTPDDAGTGDGRSLGELAKDPRLSVTALLAIAATDRACGLARRGVGGGRRLQLRARRPTATTEPVAVSASGLGQVCGGERAAPVYWVGPSGVSEVRAIPAIGWSGLTFGISRTASKPAIRRACSRSRPTRSQSKSDVTTGTGREGADITFDTGGGVAAISAARPTSEYVAFPGVDYQIEIYDPDPAVVRRLATGGDVKPVPAPEAAVGAAEGRELVGGRSGSKAFEGARPPDLLGGRGEEHNVRADRDGGRRRSSSVTCRPWLGGRRERRGALTVATYPVADAYNITKQGASGADSVVVLAPDGGIARGIQEG